MRLRISPAALDIATKASLTLQTRQVDQLVNHARHDGGTGPRWCRPADGCRALLANPRPDLLANPLAHCFFFMQPVCLALGEAGRLAHTTGVLGRAAVVAVG